jgi:two-component system phosphate regulon sensor histidine kinase PhoR
MFKWLQKSLALFLVILLLPTVIFSLYEVGTLRKNEQVIESIYMNQLDAILYSVNQYSEDVLSSWVRKIISEFDKQGYGNEAKIDEILSQLPVENCLFIYELESGQLISYGTRCDLLQNQTSIEAIIQSKISELNKLVSYLRKGYRKIETFNFPDTNYQISAFAHIFSQSSVIVLMIYNPERFMNEVLDPKIQEIAQEKFNIAILRAGTDSIIYNSDRQNIPKEITHKKPMWLIKDYDLAIELKDTTIADLAKSRTQKNILFVGIIDLILLFGIWLIYRNVNKQMELARLKSDFVSNVSHEIRTPLALIQMYIESLEMGRITSKNKIQEYYQVILQETQRLTGIINKILSFSQIESGKRRYAFTEVQLNEIVRNVIASYKLILDRNNFQLTLKLPEDLPITLADRESITDVLVNLIDNAIKYSDSSKYLEIRTGKIQKFIFLKIIDQGIGIAQKDQRYIFDKFYRVTEKNLAQKAKGSGLGLTIVKHIIDSHSGKIEVKSELGKGTEFTLFFPIRQSIKS